jgi:hypothetical protein
MPQAKRHADDLAGALRLHEVGLLEFREQLAPVLDSCAIELRESA